MKEQIINFFKGLGTIFLYFFLAAVGYILFKDYYTSSNIIVSSLSQLGTYIIILIGLCIVYHERLIEDFQNFKKENLKIALKYWLIGLGVMLATNLVINSIIHTIPANESANREFLAQFPLSGLLIVAIIGPITEELTFRASFKNAFKNWLPFCLVTAFFFGLAHIAEPNLLELLYIIPYGALGFFFAKAFYETDNIYSSIFIHMLHNTLAVLLISI